MILILNSTGFNTDETKHHFKSHSVLEFLLLCVLKLSASLYTDHKVVVVPAEVQQGACGGGDALSRPAKKVELSERPGLLCLHVL